MSSSVQELRRKLAAERRKESSARVQSTEGWRQGYAEVSAKAADRSAELEHELAVCNKALELWGTDRYRDGDWTQPILTVDDALRFAREELRR